MTSHAVLSADDHRDLRVETARGERWGDGHMACLIVPGEFRRVQDDYPILFRQTPERDRIDPYALFGFEAGENLFLDGERWDARYVPLALDVQPLLIGRGPAGPQVHLDTAHPRVGAAEGTRLFDAEGRPAPWLEQRIAGLEALDAGMREAADFVAALRRHDLLEPLTLEITLDDGATHRLVGWHTIDEERLRALDAAALGELHAAGHLLPLFMAVASLGNVGRLVARKNARHG